MGFTADIRKRLGRKRAGRVGVCVLERWSAGTTEPSTADRL